MALRHSLTSWLMVLGVVAAPWSGIWQPAEAAQCVQIDACRCIFDDDGSVIDISSLGNTDGTPRFDRVIGGDYYYYSYNPCYAFQQFGCSNAAVCQISADQRLSYQAGDANKVSWSFDGSDIQVHYDSQTEVYRQSHVTLRCNENAVTPTLQAQGETGVALLYSFTLTSKCACRNGCAGGGGGSSIIVTADVTISTGSILLIVFFVVIVVYLVGGSVFNKYQRKQQGTEVLPNIAFWRVLPGLVKDGCGFTCGKFKARKTGYDQV